MLCARELSGLMMRTSWKRLVMRWRKRLEIRALEDLADESAAGRQQAFGARQRLLEQRRRARLVGLRARRSCRAPCRTARRRRRRGHRAARRRWPCRDRPPARACRRSPPAADRGRSRRPRPAGPTAATAYCIHDPGRHPRSSTRSPGRISRSLRSISSSLNTERAANPCSRARLKYLSWRWWGSSSFAIAIHRAGRRAGLRLLGAALRGALLRRLHRVLGLDLFDRRAGRCTSSRPSRCP